MTHTRIAYTIREMKKDEHMTRTTVGGNNSKYEGCVGTPTAHLETEKLLFNSVLSRKNAKFMIIDIVNFYLMTPMDQFEHLRMNVKTIPDEIAKECDLGKIEHDTWVHTEIYKDACGLNQT